MVALKRENGMFIVKVFGMPFNSYGSLREALEFIEGLHIILKLARERKEVKQ